jgi:Na+/H+-dicarboxylate symporter
MRQQVGAPLVHGIVTAIVTFVLVQGIGVIRHIAANEDVLWSRVLSSALLSMVAGTIGGIIGGRLRHEAEPAG